MNRSLTVALSTVFLRNAIVIRPKFRADWAERAWEKVCSLRKASQTSGIPYATTYMYRLVHDPKLIDRCLHGSKCTLNPDEEAGLVKCCTWLNDRGVGVSKRDLYYLYRAANGQVIY